LGQAPQGIITVGTQPTTGTVTTANVTTNVPAALTGTSNYNVTTLTMIGGQEQSNAGTLVLGGNVAYASGGQGVIGGNLNLGAANRTITVPDGLAKDDLVVTAEITGANAGAITKAGTGSLALTNPNNNYFGTNATATVTFGVNNTGGNYALTLLNATTVPITYSTNQATNVSNVAAAVAALSSVGGTLISGPAQVLTGTSTAGASNSITLDASAST